MLNQPAQTSLWPTLLAQVEGNNGVLKVTIEFLRQIAGAQRMGPKVAEKIEAGLEVQGLRAFPGDLNRKQHEEVLLVQAGTPAFELIQAVATNTITESLVSLLERLNSLPKTSEPVVDRRELRELAEAIVDPVSQLLGLTKPYGDEEAPTKETPSSSIAHAARLAEVLPLPTERVEP